MEFGMFVACVWCFAMGLGFVLGRISVRVPAVPAVPAAMPAVPAASPSALAPSPTMPTLSELSQIVKKKEVVM
jgi:hypothetical protein